MIDIVAVFIGSGLGGACRYLLSKCVQIHIAGSGVFPWGTFVVNILGCFLIGLLYGIFNRYDFSQVLSQHLRTLLTVGFCGGFTTFSTFINENYLLFQSSNFPTLLIYVTASVIIGFLMLYVGYALIPAST